jgi:hypothetical protein
MFQNGGQTLLCLMSLGCRIAAFRRTHTSEALKQLALFLKQLALFEFVAL